MGETMLSLSLLLAVSATLSSPSSPSSSLGQPPPIAIRVDKIVAPDGALVAGGWIVVRGGKLEVVGAAAAPPNAQRLEFPGGVACPGLIDAVTSLGARGDLDEPARAFTPEVQAADAFHPRHGDFLKAARGGVTTIGLSPTSRNVVGGRLAIVRTYDRHGGHDGEQGALLVGPGPMRLALSQSAFDMDRAPTSRIGALPKLRELLQGDAMKGAGSLVVDASTPDEVRIAIETLPSRKLALLQPQRPDDAPESLESIKQSGAIALLGPYDLDTRSRDAQLPQRLAAAGIPIGFTANGDAAALRLTAALATRAGLDPKLALRALTIVPAQVLGIEGDCATLEAGKRADLVIFGGDPLDLAARVELVLVGGSVVEPAESTAPGRENR